MGRNSRKKKGERLPSYRLHKPSGQGVVTLSAKDHYLGEHGTAASEKRYKELVAAWLANDKRPLKLPSTGSDDEDDDALSIAELALQFLDWAKRHYVKNGKQTQEPGVMKYATKPLVEMFGALPVNDFGPLALRAVRKTMIDRDMTRVTVNGFIHKIRFMFRWGVGRELVKPEVIVALDAVESLGKGREGVREGAPTLAPPDEWCDEVFPHVSDPVRTGLYLQRYTGMRSGEVLQMRPCDIDMSGPIWWYVPRSHKTEHKGMERRIALGPKAQEVLKPKLKGLAPTDEIFVYTKGKGKGNVPDCITYARTLEAICKRLKKPYFRPHSLRHKRLAEVRAVHGIDAAQAVGGHSTVSMTAHYAKLTDSKAEQAAAASG